MITKLYKKMREVISTASLIFTSKTTDKMNFRLLKKLYKIHSQSGCEIEMASFIISWVKTNIPEATIRYENETGNLYITKGLAESYPCIVAHMDQVQKYHPKDFVAIETKDIIFGYSPKDRKQCGLGADDKNGIWIALQCLKKYPTMKCAFFVCEEAGCIGSEHAEMAFFEDCRFVVEPDRRGSGDLITEISFSNLCSDEFVNDLEAARYGYKQTSGLMTDIEALKENELRVSCINISCGYYEPHTDREFTVKKDILKCLRFVEHIIEDCTKVYPHENPYASCGGSYYCSWFEQEDELYDIIESELMMDPTLTPADLYHTYHPYYRLPMEEYAQIYQEVLKYNKKGEKA